MTHLLSTVADELERIVRENGVTNMSIGRANPTADGYYATVFIPGRPVINKRATSVTLALYDALNELHGKRPLPGLPGLSAGLPGL